MAVLTTNMPLNIDKKGKIHLDFGGNNMNNLQQQVSKFLEVFDSQMAFIHQSYKDGLCTYDEAMSALDKVADEYKTRIKEAFDYCVLEGRSI